MTILVGIVIASIPFLAVIALLRLADRISVRRDAVIGRQIALTDAIHRELGAVTAPVVRRRHGGAWVVTMMAPLDRPGTTAALVRITERAFADAASDRLRIVLTPDGARSARGVSGTSGRRRLNAPAPAIAGAR